MPTGYAFTATSYDTENRGFATPCWIWHGCPDSDGYAIWRERKAHRVFYEMHVGPIPEGLVIDHLCRVRNCVNPVHMEPVTPGENVLRGESQQAQNKAKTQCIRGHAFDEENTYVNPAGKRQCRQCRRDYEARWTANGGRVKWGDGPVAYWRIEPTLGRPWARHYETREQAERIVRLLERADLHIRPYSAVGKRVRLDDRRAA